MEFLKKMFAESSEVSMMRVMAFMVTCTACYIAISHGEVSVGIVGTLLAAAFTGKAVQKFGEPNGPAK